jgi:prepilin-type N-terminal cleavage/methylation domain-containing protein
VGYKLCQHHNHTSQSARATNPRRLRVAIRIHRKMVHQYRGHMAHIELMKLSPNNSIPEQPIHPDGNNAFTLAEMMVALAVFSLVVIAMVGLQVFGLKMNTFTSSKLQATTATLKVLNHMRNQIRGATSVVVGNGTSADSFTPTNGPGNALQIYPTADLSSNILFYVDTSSDKLYQLDSAAGSQPVVLASYVTNELAFQPENFQGDILSDNQEHYTIKMTLQFYKVNYGVPTNTYDRYQLVTRITPRIQ